MNYIMTDSGIIHPAENSFKEKYVVTIYQVTRTASIPMNPDGCFDYVFNTFAEAAEMVGAYNLKEHVAVIRKLSIVCY